MEDKFDEFRDKFHPGAQINMNYSSKTENDHSNVIKLRSDSVLSSKKEYEMHLNSLVDNDDDLVESLLNEFFDIEDSLLFEKNLNGEKEENLKGNSSQLDPFRVRFCDDIITMNSTLCEQISEIKLLNEKISYYLSEMNFEA